MGDSKTFQATVVHRNGKRFIYRFAVAPGSTAYARLYLNTLMPSKAKVVELVEVSDSEMLEGFATRQEVR